MTSILEQIKSPIAKELSTFEVKFRKAMKSPVPLLDRITHYIVKRKGKQMRPLFVFLSSKLFGDITESTYRAAALVELLHTATLVHDDVVDDSYQRRGLFSINALWKNKIAVLVGDYLLSKGLLLSLENKDFQLLQILSSAVKQMSEGELLQIEKTRKLNINEKTYLDITRKKTASLIASCCACGAASVKQSPDIINKLHLFGEKAGMAFQIKDDLLDFGDENTGKPKGIDIQEKKLTLPLIYTLNQVSATDKRKIINTIKNHQKDKDKVNELIKMIYQNGGIAYTKKAMERYQQEAIAIIDSFPENEAKNSLKQLIGFTIDRSY